MTKGDDKRRLAYIDKALVDMIPYLQARASISNTPQQCGLGWGVFAGVDVNLAGKISIAGYDLVNNSWNIKKMEWPLIEERKDYNFEVKSARNWAFESNWDNDTITLTVGNSLCTWTVSSKDSWITLNTTNAGYGSSTITYSVSANTDKQGRTGTITINGEDNTVSQAGDGQHTLTVDAQDSKGQPLSSPNAIPASESISARAADRNALVSGSWRTLLNETLPHVVSDPKGMYCNEFPCTKSFDTGSSVKLTAFNGSLSELVFTKWKGGSCEGITDETCTVAMNAAVTVAAVYEPKYFYIVGSGWSTYADFTAIGGNGSVMVFSNFAWTAVSNASSQAQAEKATAQLSTRSQPIQAHPAGQER